MVGRPTADQSRQAVELIAVAEAFDGGRRPDLDLAGGNGLLDILHRVAGKVLGYFPEKHC